MADERDGLRRSVTRIALTVCVAVSAVTAVAWAQAPPQPPSSSPQSPAQSSSAQPLSPEEMQRRAAAAAATMLPLISKMAEDSAEAQLRIAERPETAERIATFKKNLYDALRRKGFTADQALLLTSTTSVQSFTSNR